MTAELFARLIISDDVVNRIKDYRNHLPELDRLKQEISNLELLIDANPDPKEPMNDDLKREIKQLQDQCRKITQIKSSLPVLMYQATFDKTASKKGYQGYWRKQSAARLNGLFMLDVDHVDDVKARLTDITAKNGVATVEKLAAKLGILLIHVTPSGRGLRRQEACSQHQRLLQQWSVY